MSHPFGLSEPTPAAPAPLTTGERTFLYHHIASACLAAQAAHAVLDRAEGAMVDMADRRAFELAEEGITELRRALAHLGMATMPIDEAPGPAKVDALRLMQGGA